MECQIHKWTYTLESAQKCTSIGKKQGKHTSARKMQIMFGGRNWWVDLSSNIWTNISANKENKLWAHPSRSQWLHKLWAYKVCGIQWKARTQMLTLTHPRINIWPTIQKVHNAGWWLLTMKIIEIVCNVEVWSATVPTNLTLRGVEQVGQWLLIHNSFK